MVSARNVCEANHRLHGLTIKLGFKFQSAHDQEEGWKDGGSQAGRRRELMRGGVIEGWRKGGER